MIKRNIFSMFVFALSLQNCYSLDFIDKKFDDFNARVVAAEYRMEFSKYYNTFMKKLDALGKSSATKKNAELFRLRNLAFCSLENRHPEWAFQLKPFAFFEKDTAVTGNKQLKSVRIFLTRYAVYEEFLKNTARERAGMWYRFKSYSKHVGTKVVTFFSSFRNKEQVA